MTAPTPTFEDSAASDLDQAQFAWLNESVGSFVAMANLQPSSSVLDLGCGLAPVAIAARDILSTDHGLIVAIDVSHGFLQQAQRMLESRRLEDEIILLHGDVTHLNKIGSLRSSANQSQPSFDVIFARNLLNFIPAGQRVAALQHWATYLTLSTGRMVITLGMVAPYPGDVAEDPGEGEVAGSILVQNDGQVISRMNMMLEHEWIIGEQTLRALVTAAGFHVGEIRRMGFDGEDAPRWDDHGQMIDEHASNRHSQVLMEGGMNSGWTNADGSFSRYFKAKFKSEAVEELEQKMVETHGRRILRVMRLCPYMTIVAGVVVA